MTDPSLEDIKLFERYLAGKLTEHDAMNFELRLSLEKDLKVHFELYKLVVQTSRFQRKKQILTYIRSNAATKLTGNIWGKTWTKVSVVIIVIMGILILLAKQNRETPKTQPKSTTTETISQPTDKE